MREDDVSTVLRFRCRAGAIQQLLLFMDLSVMADYYPKTERLQLTSHDVLGNSSRYNANLEEVSLEADPISQANYPSMGNYNPSSHVLDSASTQPETRTDKILLVLFGITTADLHGLGKILIICSTISVGILIGLIIHILWGPPQVEPHGAVATDVPVCSGIGLDVLKSGGNAVDAAIAALFCLGVVNPQSSGIGGGGFALIYDHKAKKSYYVDFRETVPAAFKKEMMDQLQSKPGLSVAVPGELRGLHAIQAMYGKHRWTSLVLPSVKLARDGFNVTDALVKDLWRFEKMKDRPSSQTFKNFLYPGGIALTVGQRIARPEFAEALEKIAYNGAEEIYTGQLAKEIVEEVNKFDGVMSSADLAAYNISVKEPLSTTYGGFRVLTAPPPSSGAALLLALNILEGYGFNSTDINNPLFWHRFIEVSKFAFVNRNRLGDPKFNPLVDALAQNMTKKEYADLLRAKIRDDGVLTDYGRNVSQPILFGTTHVSVVDNNELYVTVTSTINSYYGSGIMTPSGIVLNDEMTDFAGPSDDSPDQANSPEPGKRPLSSMVPTMVYHPTRACINRIAVGGSNGTRIPGGVLNTLLNILTFGMNMTQAIEHPRLYSDLPENDVVVEAGLGDLIIDKLRSLGHNISVVQEGISVVQAVMKNNKTVTAHSDSRKKGAAAIY